MVRSAVRRDAYEIRLQVEMLSDTSPDRRPMVLSEAIPLRGTAPL
jgi:hypothetical protein